MRPGIVMVAGALALGGCSLLPGMGYGGQSLAGVDSEQIAANMTGLAAELLPPAHTVVDVQSAGGGSGGHMSADFVSAMRARGFGISGNGVPVRYSVSGVDGAVLLSLWTGHDVISRAYRPDASGKLLPVSPMSVGRGG